MSCKDGNCSCKETSHKPSEKAVLFSQRQEALAGGIADGIYSPSFQLKRAESIVRVRFKNGRSGHYINRKFISIFQDQRVVVEDLNGWDVGTIQKIYPEGRLPDQFQQLDPVSIPAILRIAEAEDIKKWLLSRKNDKQYLSDCRILIKKHGLDLFIRDVETSADGKRIKIFCTGDKENISATTQLISKKYVDRFESVLLLSPDQ